MSSLFSAVSQLDKTPLPEELQVAGAALAAFVEGDAYVGEVYSIGYDEALVQIHDYNRQQVGGIPALSFLIATRMIPGTPQTSARKTHPSFCCVSLITQTYQMLRKHCVSESKMPSASAVS